MKRKPGCKLYYAWLRSPEGRSEMSRAQGKDIEHARAMITQMISQRLPGWKIERMMPAFSREILEAFIQQPDENTPKEWRDAWEGLIGEDQ
jgi:hypothetical protein